MTEEGKALAIAEQLLRVENVQLKAEVERLKEELDIARGCKPDEYELIRSCEKAAQSDLRKALAEVAQLRRENKLLRQECAGFKRVLEAVIIGNAAQADGETEPG